MELKNFDKKIMSSWKKYNEIWDKVSNNIKKEYDNEPVYSEKYLKTTNQPLSGKKSTQIFTIIKYQKKVLNVFVYR